MKKALITGILGQAGSYLAELLLTEGYEVHGLVRRSSTFNTKRIDHIRNRLVLHYGDLADQNSIRRVIESSNPNEIYNLAAQSHVGISFEIPEYTMDITGCGVVRLLDAVHEVNPSIKIFQASSSEMFGKVLEVPQTEKTQFYPRSPYGVAKVAAHHACVNYRESYNMFICCGIMFNYESPRRGDNFVTKKITKAVAEIRAKKRDVLFLGNLESKRDWSFAGDTMMASYLMLQQEQPDDYVISSGETHSVREFLEEAFSYVSMDWRDYVKIDPRFIRPAEVDLLLGDASKARHELKWTPTVKFKELVHMMVDSDIKDLNENNNRFS